MTIHNSLQDDKERSDSKLLEPWLEQQLKCTKEKNAKTEKELKWELEYYSLLRRRRSVAATLLCTTFAFAALLLVILAMHETRKTRGMTFTFRNESLPVFAHGTQQLRTVNMLYSNKENGLHAFSPFISSSQTPGELRVVTNYTNPCYLAYVVRHPEIQNVVMITDAFFCSRTTCFCVMDVHNDSFFYKPVTNYRDLTHKMVQVPLPPGTTFEKAEHCGHLYFNNCNILLRTSEGKQRFGVLVQDTVGKAPVVAMKEQGEDDYAWLKRLDTEIKAFSTIDERLVIWIEGQLAVINHEPSWDIDESPKHRIVKASINDVDRDEVIEMLPVANGKVLLVLVMKELEENRTRVRIHAVTRDNSIVRYDELTLLNRPGAITVLARDKSFEICELVGKQLKCYSNSIVKPAE